MDWRNENWRWEGAKARVAIMATTDIEELKRTALHLVQTVDNQQEMIENLFLDYLDAVEEKGD